MSHHISKKEERYAIRVMMAAYVSLVYITLAFDKWQVADVRWPGFAVMPAGLWWAHRPAFTLLAGAPLAAFVLFLHRVARPDPLSRCLALAAAFWIACIPPWIFSRHDLGYWGYYFAYGGFLGIIQGIWSVPLRPSFLDAELPADANVELLKYEDQKWWRGLSIFWTALVAIVIAGVINYAIKGAPARDPIGQNIVYHAVFLVFPAVPGLGSIVWNMIQRTNSLQNHLQEALVKRNLDAERRESVERALIQALSRPQPAPPTNEPRAQSPQDAGRKM
jgi:hypothetical protein